ncbi:MAG: hypothetical protein LQ339_002149 [Xanthoria mediterranea]|nr:MAG: hypothetical protein LQ339_002149 [Xanthoria mediterranea]
MPAFLPSLRLRTPLLHRTFSTTRSRPLAKISIVGRLAAEPELKPTSSGQDVIKYAVGTSSGPRENRQTNWWQVASFTPEGPARDSLLGLGKGSLLYIEGNCTMNKFQDKDGNQQSAMNIVQRHIEVLDRRNSDGGDGGSGESES